MTIDALPSLDRTSPTFKTNVDTFFATELPAFSVQAEDARVEIVSAEAAATEAAGTATAQADIATTGADTATAQAGVATAAADTATTQAGIATAAAASITAQVEVAIHGAASKTTPVDADELGVVDSAAGNVLKKLTWANLKATLKTYLDTLYAGIGANSNITSLSAQSTFTNIPVHQSVLAGAATRSAIGTGLAANLLTTTTPIRIAFPGGIGNQGFIGYVGTLSADVANYWAGLTGSTTNYLFYDRNPSTGAITAISSTLPYIAQDSSVAVSVVNNQHTYVYDTNTMYVGNGSVATVVQRTAEGECVTSGVAVTSVISYAKQGEYDSGLFAVAGSSTYAKSTNIGVVLQNLTVSIADDAAGTNERDAYKWIPSISANGYGYSGATKNSITLYTAAGVGYTAAGASSSATGSAYFRIRAKRKF